MVTTIAGGVSGGLTVCCWRRWVVEAMLVMVVLTGARAVVSTLAGGISGFNPAYADGAGSNAGFNYPWAVAVDASGKIFVADSYNQRLRQVSPVGGARTSTCDEWRRQNWSGRRQSGCAGLCVEVDVMFMSE